MGALIWFLAIGVGAGEKPSSKSAPSSFQLERSMPASEVDARARVAWMERNRALLPPIGESATALKSNAKTAKSAPAASMGPKAAAVWVPSAEQRREMLLKAFPSAPLPPPSKWNASVSLPPILPVDWEESTLPPDELLNAVLYHVEAVATPSEPPAKSLENPYEDLDLYSDMEAFLSWVSPEDTPAIGTVDVNGVTLGEDGPELFGPNGITDVAEFLVVERIL